MDSIPMIKRVATLGLGLALLTGCGGGTLEDSDGPVVADSATPPVTGDSVEGVVTETMNAMGYTYIRVEHAEGAIWAAAPAFGIEVGERVIVSTAMPMADYYSKTLDRTFDVVYFTQGIQREGGKFTASGGGASHGRMEPEVAEMEISGVERAEGGLTVSEIVAQRADLAGQEVVVRGKVVKFNPEIMGTNWMHIQDGSGALGENDLTVTSQAVVEVGSTVLVRGVVAVDKDFGAGYRYAVIVEGAEVIAE